MYRISDTVALVQTIDFFTPIVDDPYWFGQIAAANALSDIYAMGAIPKTALNMVCFSPKKFDIAILKEIIRGGVDKIRESGASLLGGHSVDDEEIKYGLAVTGIVHPDKVILNEGARPGDALILTKPLGTGILNTGIKGNMVSSHVVQKLIEIMATLNKKSSEVMLSVRVNAATDVTGFGLAGHLKEMVKENIGVEIVSSSLPYFEEAVDLAKSGFVPAGLYRNRDFYKEHVVSEKEGFFYDIIFDPQTSGGLLMAIEAADVPAFAQKAVDIGLDYWIIGKFIEEPKGKIILS
ncbi:MAG: Selenide, water dikinase [Syntrophorhabdus sp. PtaU1.Bin002]|nr:MAG: Selenide, water dikinase [Syntrophorhabdus sp. PtaB.Bin006]OPY73448.1 MAG: Selenide, water dikinase [Syntrophorhabdus sp. PtaU1.Bin002]